MLSRDTDTLRYQSLSVMNQCVKRIIIPPLQHSNPGWQSVSLKMKTMRAAISTSMSNFMLVFDMLFLTLTNKAHALNTI